jgi:hypothetical protein
LLCVFFETQKGGFWPPDTFVIVMGF